MLLIFPSKRSFIISLCSVLCSCSIKVMSSVTISSVLCVKSNFKMQFPSYRLGTFHSDSCERKVHINFTRLRGHFSVMICSGRCTLLACKPGKRRLLSPSYHNVCCLQNSLTTDKSNNVGEALCIT